MRFNTSDKLIAYLTLLSGLTISAVAIYYSVAGLVAIFAAAVIPIIVMGVVLEVSKLVATVWLKTNWSRAPWFIKTYLLSAITVLMIITSMGIFGFLSKAHSDQALVSGDVSAKLVLIDEKIKIERENIANAQSVIKQMDEAVTGISAKGSDREIKLRDGSTYTRSSAEQALQVRRSQAKDRDRLTKEIELAQSKILKLQEEAAPIRAEVRKVEAEVGPIKYIAALIYGDNPDTNLLERAVRWVIIVIVAVFDPLAVILLLSSQYSFQWFRDERDKDLMEEHFQEVEDAINDVFAEELQEAELPVEEKKTTVNPHPVGWMYPKHANIQNYRVEDTAEEDISGAGVEAWNKMIEEAERAAEEERKYKIIPELEEEIKKDSHFPNDPFVGQQIVIVENSEKNAFVYNGKDWIPTPFNSEDITEDRAAAEAVAWAQEQVESKKKTYIVKEEDHQVTKTKE